MNTHRQETPAEKKTRIFRERAKKLAAENAPRDSGGESLELLEFLLGKERYAVETAFVGEVLLVPPGELLPVPVHSPFWVGSGQPEGKDRPVVDLKILFGSVRRGEEGARLCCSSQAG
jgi:purine-binding chemotaxis protein CheW